MYNIYTCHHVGINVLHVKIRKFVKEMKNDIFAIFSMKFISKKSRI